MADTTRGRLGVSALTAATPTIVYSVTDLMEAEVDIFLCNVGHSDCVVRVAILDADAVGSVANEDYILYGKKIPENGYHRISGVNLSADESVLVYSDKAGMICRVSGVEEDTAGTTAAGLTFISQAAAFGSFTDNGDTTGYLDFTSSLPAGAVPVGWKAVVATGFTGDTSAIIKLGVATDLDRFTSITDQSVFAAATVGGGVAADACDGINAAQTPRITVTSGSDFGAVTAGSMTVYLYYIDTTG